MVKKGKIFVVSSPIGNLDDITLRAIETLKEVDMVFAEDTRQTKKLLSHLGIKKSLERFDDNISPARLEKLVSLAENKKVALLTDAGTPNLSDPGYRLLTPALKKEIEVIPIPGPSALTALVAISHFSLTSFLFLGFPPAKKGREKFFTSLGSEKRAVILYESPHRIKKTLSALPPDREVIVAKELTKIYERVWRGSVGDITEEFDKLSAKELKGEFVLALSGLKPRH